LHIYLGLEGGPDQDAGWEVWWFGRSLQGGGPLGACQVWSTFWCWCCASLCILICNLM
jgi:hypothetical protein